MLKIDYDGEIYNVTDSGVIVESFYTLWDALDYRYSLIMERNNIIDNDYGSESDVEFI
jgi:hypothetical protein